MINDKKVIAQLNHLLDNGYKKIGHYGRNKSIIYLKKGKEVAIPFDITDYTFNISSNIGSGK